jgi:energy-coupling factor transporter ATP-binding protein EcfA2
MKEVQEDVKDWLLGQQDWLQEAADKLLTASQLQDQDLEAIAEILKSEDGQKVTKHRAFASLNEEPAASGELRLSGISNITGIENLSSDSQLSFGEGNLVVVYGHNGSGKSGYTRILKRASGKPRAVPLKANVFGDMPKVRQCKIDYQQGNASASLAWPADGDACPALRAIDIFDSDEAAHYLTKESSAGYVPPLVLMFEQLATTCDVIKAKLQTQQDKLVSALPVLPQEYVGTGPAEHYTKLRHTMTQADIDQMASWTETQAKTLQNLTDRLTLADPAAGAAHHRAKKAQVEQIVAALILNNAAFGTAGIQHIRALHATAQDKRRIASEAAKVKSALFDGVGQATWRAMWDAAREYSQTAYPQKQFPVTEKARCLLCHQELQPDAQERLQDFEAFVGSKLEADAKAAEKAHADAIKALPVPPTDEQLTTHCAAAGLEDIAWVEELKSFWAPARLTRASLVVNESNGMAIAAPDVAPLVAKLQARSKTLEDEALQRDEDAREFDRSTATKNKLALEAQKWIFQQKGAVSTEVERLKAWQNFETWKGLANPRRVSLKASEVTEKVITEAYVNRFNAELERLGAKRVRVAIVKTRIERGKAMHRLQRAAMTSLACSVRERGELSRLQLSWRTSPSSLTSHRLSSMIPSRRSTTTSSGLWPRGWQSSRRRAKFWSSPTGYRFTVRWLNWQRKTEYNGVRTT